MNTLRRPAVATDLVPTPGVSSTAVAQAVAISPLPHRRAMRVPVPATHHRTGPSRGRARQLRPSSGSAL